LDYYEYPIGIITIEKCRNDSYIGIILIISTFRFGKKSIANFGLDLLKTHSLTF